MIRPILTLPPKVKTLAEQNTDFTAEGAPPLGKVGISSPDARHELAKADSRAPTIMVGAREHRPSGKDKGSTMFGNRTAEEISRTIQGLNSQIENRQSALARVRRERESGVRDLDKQIRREGDEIARLEGQMVEMKAQLI